MTVRSAALAIFLALLALTGDVARSKENNTLIAEGSGDAAGYALGARIGADADLEEIEEGVFASPDREIRILTESRKITEIQVGASRFFTQKLIRPRESTLADVLEAYGEPRRTCSRDGKFNANYGDFEFQVAYQVLQPLRGADLESLLSSEIEVIVLRTSQDYEQSFEQGFQFYERKDWYGLARMMERTLCDQPSDNLPQRVRTYGMKFRDYTPHYFLGLAWLELGRCDAALVEWDKSEKSEDIERLAPKYGRIREGRQTCSTEPPISSR